MRRLAGVEGGRGGGGGGGAQAARWLVSPPKLEDAYNSNSVPRQQRVDPARAMLRSVGKGKRDRTDAAKVDAEAAEAAAAQPLTPRRSGGGGGSAAGGATYVLESS